MAAVKLPQQAPRVVEVAESRTQWMLNQPALVPGPESVLPQDFGQQGKCELETQPNAVCCKTLKGDDERRLIDPGVVRNIIIGLSDGLTVPFGLTAGLAAIGNSRLVIIGGAAELVSGAISMGIGGYLSAKAERKYGLPTPRSRLWMTPLDIEDHYRYLFRATRQRVNRSCDSEMEREVTSVLSTVGLESSISRGVAQELMKVERLACERGTDHQVHSSSWMRLLLSLVRGSACRPQSSSRLDAGESNQAVGGSGRAVRHDDIGLTPFLLKFGEQEEEVPNSRLIIAALTIGFAYAIGGLIPLLPYFCTKNVYLALYISSGVTGITLAVFGILKAYFTGSEIGWLGYTKSAVSTLAIGGVAAGASYGIAKGIEGTQ